MGYDLQILFKNNLTIEKSYAEKLKNAHLERFLHFIEVSIQNEIGAVWI